MLRRLWIELMQAGAFSHLDLACFLAGVGAVPMACTVHRSRSPDAAAPAHEACLDHMRDAVLVVDAAHRVADLNPAAERILGMDRSEVVGKLARDVLAHWPGLLERLRGEQEGAMEIAVGPEGDRRTYEATISPLPHEGGRLDGGIVVFRDVTERKRLENQLRRRATDLAAQNAALDAFAHTVAHDLKDPLTTLVGYAEVLMDYELGPPGGEVDQLLAMISEGGQRMAAFIDELLLLSSVRHTEHVECERLDMGAIVANALERVQQLGHDDHAQVILPEEWPTALGYAPWVEQVWVSLISNAVTRGCCPRELALGAEEEEATIRFWIRQSGPGLTQEEQEQLSLPFAQVGDLQMRWYGLRVSTVERIVQTLGGRLTLEGDLGHASVFSFSLKAADRGGRTDSESQKESGR